MQEKEPAPELANLVADMESVGWAAIIIDRVGKHVYFYCPDRRQAYFWGGMGSVCSKVPRWESDSIAELVDKEILILGREEKIMCDYRYFQARQLVVADDAQQDISEAAVWVTQRVAMATKVHRTQNHEEA
ncbi:hypothetical protein [Crossiella sp. CA198]|uniref:hypothetical protein n=1 Tax=Crossiella sp. CA198 TaxID=3455607 RepID=UPI003F8D110E